MKGFFSKSSLISDPPPSLVPKCGACGIYKQCKSPKMKVSGKGKKEILVVGDAPGKRDDEKGKHFTGNSGRLIREVFSNIGINMQRDCWITNSLICNPPKNASPADKEIEYCRPNLLKTIKELNPKIIILTGLSPIKSLIQHTWGEKAGQLNRWVGWTIPDQTHNAWICPTWHPRDFLTEKEDHVKEMMFENHLKKAVSKKGRPWKTIPDYKSQIKIINGDEEAARLIRKVIKKGGPCAFDIETNMLKPDGPDAKIICCSICYNGEFTFAFPWYGKVIDAMREFVQSSNPKSASNIKFEDRWIYRILGVRVKNWEHCTMTMGHFLDNRQGGINSIKFQSYALLGFPLYNKRIDQFLKAPTSIKQNKIHLVDLHDLLLYCSLDSLLEWKVRVIQRKLLGV